jgi:hypothetical protein
MNNNQDSNDIRNKVKLTQAEQLYTIKDESDRPIDFEQANGRELFNHYRHSMTNYDQVLDNIRAEDGKVTGWQQKQAAVGAAEKILEKYRDEHIKVVRDSQTKGSLLTMLFRKAGVGTASALASFLDSCSSKVKEVAKLEDSQRALRIWNDNYRVQQVLVKKLLLSEKISQDVIDKVNAVYGTRSVNKAVEMGADLFNLEKSEILKLIKSSVRYTKLKTEKTS